METHDWNTLLEKEQFIVAESALGDFLDRPHRLLFGANLLCTDGEAEVSVNTNTQRVRRGTGIMLLPNSILTLHSATADFRVSCFLFSEALFHEATFRIESSFFKYLTDNPYFVHTEQTLASFSHWMQMVEYTYNDRENIFRNIITRNRLQNVFLEIYDKLHRGWTDTPKQAKRSSMRHEELFHRFMDLVRSHCTEQRDVRYYADRLCISTRYLSSITRSTTGRSAKEMIAEALLLEIKVRLRSTDLSIQEIAYDTHFPDQSYLGRYFKRYTGLSPTEYRSGGVSKQ